MKQFVIITGGGTGTRIGGDIPKQFLCLGRLPIIMHTINKFQPFADTIFVTLPEQQFDYWKKIQDKYEFHVPHILVAGGDTRFHSVKNAVEHLQGEGLVAIHDAVRPFVTPNLIKSCFEHAQIHGTAIAAIPIKDSLRTVSNSKSKGVDRTNFFAVQTPQVFDCKIIKTSYNQPFSSHFTDDASVVESLGYDIHLVNGEELNFKITTINDLMMAKVIMDYELF